LYGQSIGEAVAIWIEQTQDGVKLQCALQQLLHVVQCISTWLQPYELWVILLAAALQQFAAM
jgi:hypothetical protein